MTKVSKEKQKETLSKMKENRKEDMLFLRDAINDKIKWAIAEKKKGIDTIKQLEDQIKDVRETVLRLDGALVVLKEMSELKSKKKEDKPEEKSNDNS